MSSPSNHFQCRWQPSMRLLVCYLIAQGLAWLAILFLDVSASLKALAWLLCIGHGAWVLPRHVLLTSDHAFTGLRRDPAGWQLWSEAGGWENIQLRPDSLALPQAVVLRFRLAGQRRVRGLCIASDSLAPDMHRRLRLRLKFSRRRWAAPG
ncbi:protein YgfX [Pseudomonas sp. UBA4194]|uniref:protein YgfX n=1 Tax=Pseudomonas sp. UBA4194 TaxID=1947317 RepID=UPI0025FF2654|nr:protein YgfX [Pseudomonas sp. UBA4194]